jgi:IS30 family transposase
VVFNSVKGEYNAKKAHAKARNRRREAKYQLMKILENRELENYVEAKMKQDWSPELIAGRIKYIEMGLRLISHESIYKYVKSVYGRLLEQHLAYKNKGRKKGRGHKTQDKLEDRIFIENRPQIVDKRLRFGDWEGDLIVSGRDGLGALLVLYERLSRYVIIKRLLRVTPDIVNYHLRHMTGGMLCVNSLTLDNDIAFRKHKEMSRIIGAAVYFCHPYHSWEKGGVENVNRLIRRYVLKGSDISQYTDEFIQMVQDKLNNRPRKCLMFKTPNEIMRENHQLKYVQILVEEEYKKMPLAFGLRV